MFNSTTVSRSAAEINTAMGRVYANMGMAVVTSMIVSFLISTNRELMLFFHTGIVHWIVLLAPLAMIFAASFFMERATRPQLQLFLHAFAALFGVSMSTIFVVYTGASIVSAFMGAAVLFAVMSFYGYFTKKSLDSWGQYLFVGLLAIIVASIINLFIGSSLTTMIISAVSILIFMALTAYDTQKIREQLVYDDGRGEVIGALSLYLDFINIFLSLLQLFGSRND